MRIGRARSWPGFTPTVAQRGQTSGQARFWSTFTFNAGSTYAHMGVRLFGTTRYQIGQGSQHPATHDDTNMISACMLPIPLRVLRVEWVLFGRDGAAPDERLLDHVVWAWDFTTQRFDGGSLRDFDVSDLSGVPRDQLRRLLRRRDGGIHGRSVVSGITLPCAYTFAIYLAIGDLSPIERDSKLRFTLIGDTFPAPIA